MSTPFRSTIHVRSEDSADGLGVIEVSSTPGFGGPRIGEEEPS